MAFENAPDHILIEKCRKGDSRAFDLLFTRYFNKLHFFALRHLQNNRELAEELVMDIMTRLWEKKDHFNAEVSLAPYLFRALKNAIIDHYKKKALQTIPLAQAHEDVLLTVAADNDVVLSELESHYRSGLEKLSPQRRLVFEMSREQQMTYPEIAKHLNLSVKTVESHISAALVLLRKDLREHGDSLTFLILLEIFITK